VWFDETFKRVPARVVLALGQIAWRSVVDWARRHNHFAGPLPKFGHEARVTFANGQSLVGSYHPSQQNTFTGKLTEEMFDRVFRRCRQLLGRDD
jgi:uracil-DNA glycosylase